ncbi:MAG: U32 family peptidase [Eubacteriales bacterium]|nr:U32 family peptidase [Eubacteriales bacterium]
MRSKVELLAPARTFDGMKIAFAAGADAVYAGGQRFSARAYADNFSDDEIRAAIRYARMHGKKFYLAVNTLLKEEELSGMLYDTIRPFYEAGLDACIVQDTGVFSFLHRTFPDMDIHISTQSGVHHEGAARFFEEKGARRVVVTREISLSAIRAIHRHTSLEIEAFVHGALCYAFSGQCLFSSMLGTRSGNRGRCAQPCRLPYDVLDGTGRKLSHGRFFPLSMKDFCGLDVLPEMLAAGVTSFKIEGRMKSPEYVAGTTAIYRKYLDMAMASGAVYQVDPADRQMLLDLYNRGGFNEGYYRDRLRKMISTGGNERLQRDASAKRRYEVLRNRIRRDIDRRRLTCPVTMHFEATVGQSMSLTMKSGEHTVHVSGPVCEMAGRRPATTDEVRKHCTALGETEFEAEQCTISLKGSPFIPVSTLKQMRREAVAELTAEYDVAGRREPRLPRPLACPSRTREEELSGLTVSVRTVEQFDVVNVMKGVSRIYLDMEGMDTETIAGLAARATMPVYVALPTIYTSSCEAVIRRDLPVSGYLVKNFESWYYVTKYRPEKRLILNWNIYVMNAEADTFARAAGADETFVPPELTRHETDRLRHAPENLLIYGYIPLMYTRQDVSATVKRRNEAVILRDRKRVLFKTSRTADNETGIIHNSVPLDISDRYGRLKRRYQPLALFTHEDTAMTLAVMRYLLGDAGRPFDSFTTGHFNRGVE